MANWHEQLNVVRFSLESGEPSKMITLKAMVVLNRAENLR
jgi:hypothetical protein